MTGRLALWTLAARPVSLGERVPKLTFLPQNLEVQCAEGESVFDAARRSGIPVSTACVGRGTCGLCRVRVMAGEENLSAFTEAEKRHLGNVYFLTKERLSCQTRLNGDATVEARIQEARPLPLKRK
ncbi:MAG: 2Fe-2S iron-sulfur cluster-binding protein [Deltaproteobacteria bacterium]|nr:2Fe-2S iron-sulfur cluster-binding protein [Deltaproteobacteria bacterium]